MTLLSHLFTCAHLTMFASCELSPHCFPPAPLPNTGDIRTCSQCSDFQTDLPAAMAAYFTWARIPGLQGCSCCRLLAGSLSMMLAFQFLCEKTHLFLFGLIPSSVLNTSPTFSHWLFLEKEMILDAIPLDL